MKYLKAFTGLLFILIASCQNDDLSIVSGRYTENSPVVGRSQLNFISNKLVVKSEAGSSYTDTYIYTFSKDKITLTPAWTKQFFGSNLDFKKIDANTFQIENLYPSIPEAPKSYMIFKK